MLPRQTHLPDLHSIERLAGAAFVASSEPLVRDIDAQAVASLGDWLDRAAHATAGDSALPSVAETATTAKSGTAAQVAVSKLSIQTQEEAKAAEEPPPNHSGGGNGPPPAPRRRPPRRAP